MLRSLSTPELFSMGNDSNEPCGSLNSVKREMVTLPADPMAELCDVQDKDELSPMMEFLGRLSSDSEQKDVSNVRSIESTTKVKEDVKRLIREAAREESNRQHYQEELEVIKLRKALQAEHEAINALSFELEEERKAAAIAATETMAMISRLQKEKGALQMEARQYQRLVEEKVFYDHEIINIMNDILLEKEDEKHELETGLEICKENLFSEGARSWMYEGTSHSQRQYSGGTGLPYRLLLDSSLKEMPPHDSSLKEKEMDTLMLEGVETDPPLDGTGVEMLLLEAGMETDSTLSNDAIIDQFDHSMMNLSSSLMSTPPSPSKKQPGVEEGNTWKECYSLTSQDQPNRNNPERRPVEIRESTCSSKALNFSDYEHRNVTTSTYKNSSEFIHLDKSGIGPEGRPSSQAMALEAKQIAWNVCPENFQQHNYTVSEKFKPLSRPADDKLWGETNSNPKLGRIDCKDETSWNGEDLGSPSVHDVYEVKRENNKVPSDNQMPKIELATLQRKDWECPKRYGQVWESHSLISPSRVSRKSFSLQALNTSRHELGSSSNTPWIENHVSEHTVGNRLGKPDSSFPEDIFLENRGVVRELLNTRKAASVFYTTKGALPSNRSMMDNPEDVYRYTFNQSLLKDCAEQEPVAFQEISTATVDDQIEKLKIRLQSVEAEREFLKKTISSLQREGSESLKRGSGEMAVTSYKAKRVSNVDSEVRKIKRLSFSILVKVFVFAYTSWIVHRI